MDNELAHFKLLILNIQDSLLQNEMQRLWKKCQQLQSEKSDLVVKLGKYEADAKDFQSLVNDYVKYDNYPSLSNKCIVGGFLTRYSCLDAQLNQMSDLYKKLKMEFG